MARPKSLKPAYCHHKSSGRAYVTLDGHRVYLGAFGTPASRDAYDRAIGEWIARGRRAEPPPEPSANGGTGITVTELIDAFWTHATGYYVGDDGTQGRELENFRGALRLLKRLYGPTAAGAFGPRALKVVRQAMIDAQWTRRYVNRQTGRLRHVFKWGVENELVPPAVHQGLAAVGGLKRGKGGACEAEAVTPVPEEYVCAI